MTPEELKDNRARLNALTEQFDKAAETALRRHGLRACAACGEPTTGHWCSNACRRAEDGLSFEEAAEMERMQEDGDE